MNTSIVICGKKFDVGTKVVLWDEPGGLNAYDTSTYKWKEEDRKTGKVTERVVAGVRYSKRTWRKNPTLAQLQGIVTQFFLHHSGMYHSRGTFDVLHKERRLSCHFIMDDDGTIYQTLDLKWKAWHGGNCNATSVGIEIDSRAHVTKFPTAYDEASQKRYNVGPRYKYRDNIQEMDMWGYEYNDAQYKALINLTLGITKVFPIIGTNADFPRGSGGEIFKKKIANPASHLGFICHFHASESKNDPIAFDFPRFLNGVNHKNPLELSTLHPRVVEVPDPVVIEPIDKLTWGLHPGPVIVMKEPDFPEPDQIDLDDWRDIQEALVELGYNPGDVDGVLGKRTKKALRSFQASNKLTIDGVWGPNTRAKMTELLRRKRNG